MPKDFDEALFADPHSAMDTQLQSIIAQAREIASVAEELLRELLQRGGGSVQSDATACGSAHMLAMVPRLLDSTEQQLAAVLSALKATQD